MTNPVDHLVFATNELQSGIEQIQELLGITAVPGGSHPGLGTCNAYVALGPECYLEIIGPDPGQTGFQGVRPFGIDHLNEARLVGWAARRQGLAAFAKLAKANDLEFGEVIPLARVTPEGNKLEWEIALPMALKPDQVNVIPFFIDWGKTPHPASQCTESAKLVRLELQHPRPAEIVSIADSLELEVNICEGLQPRLLAQILCRDGQVELS